MALIEPGYSEETWRVLRTLFGVSIVVFSLATGAARIFAPELEFLLYENFALATFSTALRQYCDSKV